MSITEFLERDDVLVCMALDEPGMMVVYQKDWTWEGRGKNVVDAARMAMLMEEKYKNGWFRIAARSIGKALAKGAMEKNLSTITIHTRHISEATALHKILLELKESCK
jgi:hypothetical protein